MRPIGANWLLRSLPYEDSRSIIESSTRIELKPGSPFLGMNEVVEAILFPETLTATFSSNHSGPGGFEIALIGRDGMIGWHALLGCPSSPYFARAVGKGGSALRRSSSRRFR